MLRRMLDAHIHVVDPATTVEDVTGNPAGAWWAAVDASPGAVRRRVAEAGVQGGVLVQAVGAHGFDNTVAIQAARSLSGEWRAMVALHPLARDPLAALGDAVARGARGLRLFSVPTPERSWLDTDRGVGLVERCGRLGVGPAVCCLPEELPAVGRLARAVPDVEIALDHAGFLDVGGTEIERLARHDNLVVKLSTGVFDHSSMGPAATVHRLVDLFGADRIAWGSDHPQVHDRAYPELVALIGDALEDLPEADRTAILDGTTRRLWLR